jgi:4-hydroxybenzoate polyprenyltransferase
VLDTIRNFGRLVRFSHTIFGLPFALVATALAHRHALGVGLDGLTPLKLVWIVVAFTGARTAAMGFNRIVDRDIDAENERTAARELPAGVISLRAAVMLTMVAAAVFVLAAAMLGRWPLRLAGPCLVIVLSYSLFKRFSWSTHLFLGLALALAPGGAWIAVIDGFSGWPVPLALMAAVASWVAGFDVLYALQDEAFDREHGLHSIPARFGTRGALRISTALHVVTVSALVAVHLLAGLGPIHLVGVVGVAFLLAYEHRLVRPDDLSRIDAAFFAVNGWVSIGYLVCAVVDVAVG